MFFCLPSPDDFAEDTGEKVDCEPLPSAVDQIQISTNSQLAGQEKKKERGGDREEDRKKK